MNGIDDEPSGAKQNRAQRRAARAQARRHAEQVGEVAAADRAFFDAHSGRSYRGRPATPSEMEAAGEAASKLPAGFVRFAAVRVLGPAQRLRAIIAVPADTAPEMSEPEARALWERAVPAGSEACHMADMAALHFGGPCDSAPENTPSEAMASFCAHLKVSKGAPGYASAEVAMCAVNRFVARTGLPRASFIVVPGEALHVAWLLATDPSSAEWARRAAKLEGLARFHGLRLAGPIVRELPFDLAAIYAQLRGTRS